MNVRLLPALAEGFLGCGFLWQVYNLSRAVVLMRRSVMKRLVAIVWSGTLVLAYMTGSAIGPAGSAAQTAAGAPQQPPPAGALPPGEYSKIQLAPDQGEPTHYSGDALRKSHAALQARAKSGQAGVAPRDFMTPLVTRNYCTSCCIGRRRPRNKRVKSQPPSCTRA